MTVCVTPYFMSVQFSIPIQLQQCVDELQMKEMLDSPEFEFRFACGVTQPTHTMKLEDKSAVISALCRHFTVFSTVAEMEQFRKGLQTLNFDALLLQYPCLMRQVFRAADQPITYREIL